MYFNKIKIFTLIKTIFHKVCICLSLGQKQSKVKKLSELGGRRERRKEGVGKKRKSEGKGRGGRGGGSKTVSLWLL